MSAGAQRGSQWCVGLACAIQTKAWKRSLCSQWNSGSAMPFLSSWAPLFPQPVSCRAASPRVWAVTPCAAVGTRCLHGSGTLSPRVVPRKCPCRTGQEGTHAALREGTNFSCFHLYDPTVASRLLMWMMPSTATPPTASDHMARDASGKCWGITELLPCLLPAPVLGAHRAVPGVYHDVPVLCTELHSAGCWSRALSGTDIFGAAGWAAWVLRGLVLLQAKLQPVNACCLAEE